MKAKDFVADVRNSNQRLWDSYQLYLSTKGEEGMNCFTPDKMKELLERTDKEIVKQGLAKGVYIEDAEKFLNSI